MKREMPGGGSFDTQASYCKDIKIKQDNQAPEGDFVLGNLCCH